jgi:4-methyl-5(b-hydroxyethyl)-thiazole monophosphate biosynthesis
MKPRILVFLAPGFEEIETITPVDLLRRAGADVIMASLGEDRRVVGRSGIEVQADATLASVMEQTFALVVIPGGAGVKALRADGRPAQLARAQAGASRAVAAICAGPLVLSDAGLLEGRRFTAHFSVNEELPGARADDRVVEDGPVITSRGAGTAIEFGLALVARLFGSERADEVSKSIMR